MNLKENLRQAIRNLRVNRMRTFLTMLGIIIGISAVITITTLGASLQKTLSLSFEAIGGMNNINAYMTQQTTTDENGEDVVQEWTEDDYIAFQDLQSFLKAFDGRVKNFILVEQAGDAKASYVASPSAEPGHISMIGTTGGYIETQNMKLLAGRDLTMRDQTEAKAVCLVSDLFVKYNCDGQSPIGKAIDVELTNGQVNRFYVVGVYEFNRGLLRETLKNNDSEKKLEEKDVPTSLYIPYQYLKANMSASDEMSEGISDFNIVASPGEDVKVLQEDIKAWFGDHKWKDGNTTLETYSSMEDLEQVQEVLKIVTIVISVIAAISLLVGGVGVMNIMLVSVVERTKEIGIRKALGAQNRDIERQFLSETVLICLIGGLIGVLGGILFGFVGVEVGASILKDSMSDMEELSHVRVHPSMLAILISVGFSILTGLVFGLYPARRAARMSPIDALRYE